MNKADVFLAWAPKDSIWSPWVVPVAFAQLNCADLAQSEAKQEAGIIPEWLKGTVSGGRAYVLDMPGEIVARMGVELARLGVRPVPIIDGSPSQGEFSIGPGVGATDVIGASANVVVDMTELLRSLCEGAAALCEIHLAADAMPAFLLDSKRMTGHRVLTDESYDNRWQVFPQDFPSAKFLLEHAVQRVLLVQGRKGQPQEDLAHVLLRWQEGGVAIESVGLNDGSSPERIVVARPSRFRAIWYRALAILGLRRHWSGGFGGFPMSSSG
ncbi:MAG TPA: hypothetical protein VKT53_10125 [Candidatus Acidoferrum sp.]|nr:hypothetical protein [Candidatus Acidoferrum sp.]